MIKLDVDEICHTCPNFEVEQCGGDKLFAGGELYIMSDIYIRCSNYALCSNIRRHLENKNDG